MQKDFEISCPYCNKMSGVRKYGFTKKKVQRYKCECGKSFILPVDEKKRPNCPKCKSNTNVIRWGEIKGVNWSPRYKQQRYFCKIHKVSFCKTYRILDEEKIIKAYLACGDIGLREFVIDEQGVNVRKFNACMEIIREYEKISAELDIIYGI